MNLDALDRTHMAEMVALRGRLRRLEQQYGGDRDMAGAVYEYGVLCEEIAKAEHEMARIAVARNLEQLKASRERLRRLLDGGNQDRE